MVDYYKYLVREIISLAAADEFNVNARVCIIWPWAFTPLRSKYEVGNDYNRVLAHTCEDCLFISNTVINTFPMTLRYRFRTKHIADAFTGLLHMLDISRSNVNVQS